MDDKLPDDMTLGEARQLLRDGWDEGLKCPCCTQFVKRYKRPIHAVMARALIRLYHMDHNTPGEYFYAGDIVKGISSTGTNDLSKLRYWGLIVEQEKDPDDPKKRTSGHWAITHKGRRFVRDEITVPSHIVLFNKRKYGEVGDPIGIRAALGKQYNYEEIMAL